MESPAADAAENIPPHPSQSTGQRPWRRPTKRCLSIWNVMLLFLVAFFAYVIASSWISAFMTGNYRGLGISLCLLLLGTFICWRSRALVIRRANDRQALERALAAAELATAEEEGRSQRGGVPEQVLKSFNTFRLPGVGDGVAERAPASGAALSAAPGSNAQVQLEQNAADHDMQELPPSQLLEACNVPTSDMQCGVCLMDYRPGDELCRLPCPSQHVYHATCITMWLDAHVTCPYCKFNLIQQAHELV